MQEIKKINLKHFNGSYDIYIGENLIENIGEYIENSKITNKKPSANKTIKTLYLNFILRFFDFIFVFVYL